MIHFLRYFCPSQRIDVVEIDPVVVGLARKYFGIPANGNVVIHTVDGFEYLGETKEKYDAIYMDAFLRPCRDTGNSGIPVRLKTVEFLRGIQSRLQPRGIVVFNLHSGEFFQEELGAIREAFSQTYLLRVPERGNRIVVATTAQTRKQTTAIEAEARRLDARKRAGFSFHEIARQLQP
jgi:spermidine synthase